MILVTTNKEEMWLKGKECVELNQEVAKSQLKFQIISINCLRLTNNTYIHLNNNNMKTFTWVTVKLILMKIIKMKKRTIWTFSLLKYRIAMQYKT